MSGVFNHLFIIFLLFRQIFIWLYRIHVIKIMERIADVENILMNEIDNQHGVSYISKVMHGARMNVLLIIWPD